MSHNDEMSDFANFYRTYRLGRGTQPQASTAASQNPAAVPSQRPPIQRPPIQRPTRQAPLQNAPNPPVYNQSLNEVKRLFEEQLQEFKVLFEEQLHEVKRLFEELKQGHNGIFVVLNGMQNM